MHKLAGITLLIGTIGLSTAASAQYLSCTGPFADCTQALCTLKGNGNYTCTCHLATVVSATIKALPCQGMTDTQIQSRFTAVKYAQVCSPEQQPNANKTWVNCLGIMCTRNGSTPTCSCPVPTGQAMFPYVIVQPQDIYQPEKCTDPGNHKAYSSSLLPDADGIQKFLDNTVPIITNPPTASSQAPAKQ